MIELNWQPLYFTPFRIEWVDSKYIGRSFIIMN